MNNFKQNFSSSENIQVLWESWSEFCLTNDIELISFEEFYKFAIFFIHLEIFEKNAHLFFHQLLEINKCFLLEMKKNGKKKINNNNNIIKNINNNVPITNSEFKKAKQEEIALRLIEKQSEFNEAYIQQIPPMPIFQDNIPDCPPINILEELQRIRDDRNYDNVFIEKKK